MAITDATTSLGTAWTEQPLGGMFTAGTLTDVTELISMVESRLQRGTLSATSVPTTTQVQTWLVIAKQELAESKGYTWTRRRAQCSTVSGTYRYGMPPDYAGGPLTIRNTTSSDYSRTITIWPAHIFDQKFPRPEDRSVDEPIVATVKNNELWMSPPPNGVYTLEMEYQRSGDDNTATDFSWLPEIERSRCCDYATYKGFAMLQQWDAAQLYHQEWNFAIQKSKKADAKKKWTGSQQALSVFQEHSMRGYIEKPQGGH